MSRPLITALILMGTALAFAVPVRELDEAVARIAAERKIHERDGEFWGGR